MSSPLLARPGAVPAEAPDADVAAHYGEPVQEGRAMERAAAWTDRSDRGVVRVSGADRLTLLHSLTSQAMEGMAPGTASEALLMDANGRIRHHMAVLEDGAAVWLHTEPGQAAELAAFLDRMRFMMRVEVEDLTGERAVLTVTGPDRDAALAAAGEAAPEAFAEAPVRRADEETDLLLPRPALSAAARALTGGGARAAGMWAYEAARIAAHRPRQGLDTDERTIPHEAGWVGTAVHLEKGCYPGQETVARVHNLGRPPRRLVMLHLDGTAERLPARGAAIELDGRAVGAVGSSARHHELGPVALGLVKRNVPVDAEFTVDGIAAGQEVVVPPDTGANADIRLRRSPR
ncbi:MULTISPECIES: CAF17-like 4Fe-4S cluster assembly/insertion protein YgfZ [Nocardiopsis]|uniref:CAF17-like 4Fe-4S cluster assembly/insertion protein YgfZ n=1 Tax=Nocardiopsis TaxID=2013 RepID=UPI00034C009F|nr:MULTISPECIES: glycine cleavage T C-terminal barrel domain-containing protein [Nocardiopsis]